MRLLTTGILILGAAAFASADNVTFKNGSTLQGTYLGGTARQIRIDVNGEVRTYDIEQVRSVEFGGQEGFQSAAPPPPRREEFGPGPRRDYDGPPQQYNGPAQQPANAGLTIPADTPITVRMIDSVNSETSRLGATYRASVDEPVFAIGQEVIPRGADVTVKLVEDKKSGHIQGQTVLTLAIDSVNVNGRAINMTTTDVRTASNSRGGRSGAVIGGGAALGAIVGALAGGGKGAAIGAGSGAALGGATQVLTGGQKVKIPSETRLTFRLQNPVQI